VARVTILLALVALAVLALEQCLENSQVIKSTLDFAATQSLPGQTNSTTPEQAQGDRSSWSGGGELTDPLGIKQEGIALKATDEQGNILWYQSIWDLSQSRVLLEHSLALQGWQALSSQDELLTSFSYAPAGHATGALLQASFYQTEGGCSILIELL